MVALENSLPNALERFGTALGHDGCSIDPGGADTRCHEVGVLVAIRQADGVEIVLSAKSGLSEEEERTLWFQVNALLGAHVHQWGGEPVQGWYCHDKLK